MRNTEHPQSPQYVPFYTTGTNEHGEKTMNFHDGNIIEVSGPRMQVLMPEVDNPSPARNIVDKPPMFEPFPGAIFEGSYISSDGKRKIGIFTNPLNGDARLVNLGSTEVEFPQPTWGSSNTLSADAVVEPVEIHKPVANTQRSEQSVSDKKRTSLRDKFFIDLLHFPDGDSPLEVLKTDIWRARETARSYGQSANNLKQALVEKIGLRNTRILGVSILALSSVALIMPGEKVNSHESDVLSALSNAVPHKNVDFKVTISKSQTVSEVAAQLGLDPETFAEEQGLDPQAILAPGENVPVSLQAPLTNSRPEDTIATLATRYGVDASILISANPEISKLSDTDKIPSDTQLVVPRADIQIITLAKTTYPQDTEQSIADATSAAGLDENLSQSIAALNPDFNGEQLVVSNDTAPEMIPVLALAALAPDVIVDGVPTEGSPGLNPEQVTELRTKVVSIADSFRGIKEDPATPNHSKQIDELFQMGLTGKKAEWCGSFVSRVFKDAGIPFAGGSKDGHKGEDWQLEFVNSISLWVRASGGQIFDRTLFMAPEFAPLPGDIVVFNQNGNLFDNHLGVNHVEIVRSYDPATGIVETIGGNVHDAVSVSTRDLRAELVTKHGRSSNIAGFLRVSQFDPIDPVEEAQDVATEPSEPGALEVRTHATLPEWSRNAIDAQMPKIETLKSLYQEIEAATGVPWQYVAALHYREGGNRPTSSMMAGEKIGGINPDTGKAEGTTLLANGLTAAKHFKDKAKSVYGIDVRPNMPADELAKSFLAFNRGAMYRNARKHIGREMTYLESPYPMNGYTEDLVLMKFPNVGSYSKGRGWGEPASTHGRVNKMVGALTLVAGLGGLDGLITPPAPTTTQVPEEAPTTTAAQPITTTTIVTMPEIYGDESEIQEGKAWVSETFARELYGQYFIKEDGSIDEAALTTWLIPLPKLQVLNDDQTIRAVRIRIDMNKIPNQGEK